MRTLAILLLCIVGANAACELRLQNPQPIVVKRFGSKTAIVKRNLPSVQLSTNETVTFHCPTGVSIGTESYRGRETKLNAATVELICYQDGTYLDAVQIIEKSQAGYISCSSSFSQALYESNSSLPGCGPIEMTLLMGYKVQGYPDVKLLGLCYDLSASRLRFVSFLANAPQNVLLSEHVTQELDELHLDTYIGSLSKYFHYPSEAEFKQLVTSQKGLGELFVASLFQYSSLLQDESQLKELHAYKDMLSIVWMRSLLLGNWKHFLNALRAAGSASDHMPEQFEVRLGVSGVATLPQAHNCNSSVPLWLESSDGISLPVPAHIWAHIRSLQPMGSGHDEFVLVAHNSPYVNILELYTFCEDICDKIPWIQHTLFGQLHLVPAYGVIHCCRMDQLEKLTDFRTISTTKTMAMPTSTDSTM